MSGELRFFEKLRLVLEGSGFEVKFRDNTPVDRLLAEASPGYSIFLMQEPVNELGLTVRRNYFYPFWNIQRTAKRWEWPIAAAAFNATMIPKKEARAFAQHWRRRLFPYSRDAARREGFVYVPLQGRLALRRSFQSCSPLEMLDAILENERDRKVVATLHPKENYTLSELSALDSLERRFARFSIDRGKMEELLNACDYVATQNSSVALFGYFFHKPAVLFAKTDFHHIAAKVESQGVAGAMKEVAQLNPDYEAYLCWFFKWMSINVEKHDAEERIQLALERFGWPMLEAPS